jgi:hypothetical protein
LFALPSFPSPFLAPSPSPRRERASPFRVGRARRGKLAIVNLQPTFHDRKAAIRLFYPLDDFCDMLGEELGAGAPMAAGAGAGGSCAATPRACPRAARCS